MLNSFLKDKNQVGLREALKNYKLNCLLVKHAMQFRNDCECGEWSKLKPQDWPHLTHRVSDGHAPFNHKAYAEFTKVLGGSIPITTWELRINDYDAVGGPNGRTTPCIAVSADYFYKENLRLGRVVSHVLYIPLYTR